MLSPAIFLLITFLISLASSFQPNMILRRPSLTKNTFATLHRVRVLCSQSSNNNGGSELAINNPNSIARKQDLQALRRQVSHEKGRIEGGKF